MNIIIGLGGNKGDVRAAFFGAVAALNACDGVKVSKTSSLYRTEPVGPDQPPFLNAAVLAVVEKAPRGLLRQCQAIEASAGRNRADEKRWGPRTLDLDLLVADAMVCKGPILELPHPRFAERAFALIPAVELAPSWVHATEGKTLSELAARLMSGDSAVVEMIGPW